MDVNFNANPVSAGLNSRVESLATNFAIHRLNDGRSLGICRIVPGR